jgi:cytochrome c biogenesis protein CcmG/thiol:disulfide interchange protein DsbE
LPSTPSSADARSSRRPSRAAVVALLVVSVAIPAGVLALILRAHHSTAADAASNGPLITPKKARIGSLAPDFTLPGLDGKPVTLSALRGRAVVLTFFASWCHPCEQDMPILERAQHDDGDRVEVVGVNYQDFPNDTRAFVRRLGVTFPTLVEDSTDNPVAARYDVHAMPDTLFIDARGVVRDRLFGQTSEHDLESAVGTLLRD